ncbi:MAG: DUF6270 domain-containing protein [Phenylobacterium sp.]
MARVAIIGSCITRDIWRVLEEPLPDLLYFSRTSLPSLTSRPVVGLAPGSAPPGELTPSQHAALLADLQKTALRTLADFRPSHLILDFVDERYDLLEAGGAVATHSWELKVSGYLEQPWGRAARSIARNSAECAALWRAAAPAFLAALREAGLGDVPLVLHEAQWAGRYRAADGALREFPDALQIWTGLPASLAEHNALLTDYQAQIRALAPQAVRVAADESLRIADESHRWGLSPFHYIEAYYRDVRDQLRGLGI